MPDFIFQANIAHYKELFHFAPNATVDTKRHEGMRDSLTVSRPAFDCRTNCLTVGGDFISRTAALA